jgi:hypothetical protein
MTVSLVNGRISRQAVEIALPFHIVDPDSFSALDHNVERVVVMSPVLVFELNEFLGLQKLFGRRHGFLSGFEINIYCVSKIMVSSAMRT